MGLERFFLKIPGHFFIYKKLLFYRGLVKLIALASFPLFARYF